MLRGRNNIILNNIQGIKNVNFSKNDYGDGHDLIVEIDCVAIDNIVIPKWIYALKKDVLEEYYLAETYYCDITACKLLYETDIVHELNDKGKDMYPLYCMMINRDKYADIDIDIDDFMKQYTTN